MSNKGLVLRQNMTDIANAINNEVSNPTQYKPREMAPAITNMANSLKALIPQNTVTGTNELIADKSAGFKAIDYSIEGKSEQESTTGANKLEIESGTKNGITLVNNGDGSYHISGTASETTLFHITARSKVTVLDFLKGLSSGNKMVSALNNSTIDTKKIYIEFSTLSGVGTYNATNAINRHTVTSDDITRFQNLDNLPATYIAILSGTTVDTTIYPQLVLGEIPLNEPYTGGQPSPSPEYKRPIKSVGDLVIGKNKAYISSITPYNVTATLTNDEIKMSGSVNNAGSCGININGNQGITLLANKTYTFSFIFSGILAGGTYKTIWVNNQNFGNMKSNGTTSYTITPTQDTKIKTVNLDLSRGLTFTDYSVKLQIEEGSTATPYEPYTEKYEIPVKIRGKNLFDVSNIQQGSSNFAITTDFIKISNTTITESWKTDVLEIQYNTKIYEYNSNKTEIKNTLYFNLNTKKQTVILDSNTKYIKITFYCDYAISPTTFSDRFSEVQLEVGTTATPYEPYHEPRTVPIYLDEPLRSNKDMTVADEISFATSKRTNKISDDIFDGSDDEDWKMSYGIGMFHLDNIFNSKPFVVGHNALSNYYKYNYIQSGLYSGLQDGEFALQKSSSSYNLFIKNLAFSTPLEFKTWLSQHLTEAQYELATPTEETIQLPELPLFEGTNIIEIDTDVLPSNAEVVYYKDWRLG